MPARNKSILGDESKSSVSLRPFPYPFKAGLAICSDIDGCDRATFLEVHRFLNGKKQGLGLPVADSFFGLGRENGQMAYFQDQSLMPSQDADLIVQAIKAGLIDSIHSWGDFNDKPPDPLGLREMAEKLTRTFRDNDLMVRIWINHGNPQNCQNLKARMPLTYQGDDPHSRYYTADLIKQLGVKFYWWSEVLSWPLSGKHPIYSRNVWPKLTMNAIKNIIKVIIKRRSQVKTAAQITNLAVPIKLRDGGSLFGFSRFSWNPKGLWTLPTRHTLHLSLNSKVLDELIEQQGYLIVYTHLGLPQYMHEDLFPSKDLEALVDLSTKYHNGHIWVARTADLLTYWMVSNHLDWETQITGDKLIINIKYLDDPTTGPRLPSKAELAGLCFYAMKPQNTVICLNGKELNPFVNATDHTGRGSIGFPVAPAPATDLLEE